MTVKYFIIAAMKTTIPGIREAGMQDVFIIREIAHETWPVAYKDILSEGQVAYMLGLMYSPSALNKQLESGTRFLLAFENGRYLGFAGFTFQHADVCKLDKLYVLPSSQGSGIGSALLNAVIKLAVESHAKELILQVNKRNNAKLFYERNGFRYQSDLVVDIGNGYVMDDYVMTKVI